MKIIYKQNPFRTEVLLDKNEKLEFHKKVYQYLSEEDFELTEEQKEEIYNNYLKELTEEHGGDCTCAPCSCPKCHAESLLEIDTIQGLDKHSAYKIQRFFRTHSSIDEVIKELHNYEPELQFDGSEKYIPRWKEEAAEALVWLQHYKDVFLKE